MPDKPPTPDERLQLEFNRWAADGEGEKMERHHLDITGKTIRLMNLRPGERVLDLGCGSGWATRLLARLVGEGPEGFGQVVGLDVSDEMVRQAREASKDFENILYVWGSAQQIPWEENFFDKVLSVESFYYYPDQDRALMELFRVMAPRGKLFILINLYKDNEYSLQWVDKLKVPVHVRSSAEYVELLKKHAFENVEVRRIPDDTPTPDDYKTKSFRSLDDLRAFKREGALLLMATKPDLRTPAPGYTIYLRLNLAVVIVVFIVMTQILHRTQRAPILGMMHVDSAIHVFQPDARAAAAQLSAQVVAHEVVIVHVQAEVVIDAAGNRPGFDLGLGVRRNRQRDRSVHGLQLNCRTLELVEVRFQMAVDCGQLRPARQILGPQLSVYARRANFAACSGDVQLSIDELDLVEPRRTRDSQGIFHTRRVVVRSPIESVVVPRILRLDGNGIFA